jgi:ABC-type glutathione transport system ATPase component
MPEPTSKPLLEARALRKVYAGSRGRLRGRHEVVALGGVSLAIREGATFALVGESGSGKSTLARCLAALEQPDVGEVHFRGRMLRDLEREDRLALRRSVQMVFQDSSSALNPRFTAEQIITEPLLIQSIGDPNERRGRAQELMEKVGLDTAMLSRRPAQFSGGQRQRLAIARALVLRPSLLILDEALTGLDLPVQAQILALLRALKNDIGLTYLFISHDLRLMAGIADEIAIMYRGQIVECGIPAEIVEHPQHEHTRALIAAVPGRGLRPAGSTPGPSR